MVLIGWQREMLSWKGKKGGRSKKSGVKPRPRLTEGTALVYEPGLTYTDYIHPEMRSEKYAATRRLTASTLLFHLSPSMNVFVPRLTIVSTMENFHGCIPVH